MGPSTYTKLLPCHPTDSLGRAGRRRGIHQAPCPRTGALPDTIQQVLNPTPLNPTPETCHKRKTEVVLQLSESCAAETALQDFAFLQCGCHFNYRKLRCNNRKTSLQHWKSCAARKWRLPAHLKLQRLGSHV